MTNIENAQIKELSKKIDSLYAIKEQDSEDIKDIKKALLGDEYNVDGGLITRIKMLEEWRSSAEINMNKTKTHWDLVRQYGALIAWAATVAYEIVMAFVKK